MAERRMFAKKIVNSARFLKMPTSSRLLYYDLGMNADDEGVVEAFTVMRMTGATEDDLRVLISKGFVRLINDELVSLILDWKQNNLIKKDRFHKSIYHDVLIAIENNEEQRETTWEQIGTQMEPESSLGKSSLGKDNTSRFVKPSVEEVREYCNERGNDIVAEEFIDFYESKGWKVGKTPMKDWKACIRTWEHSRKDKPKEERKKLETW